MRWSLWLACALLGCDPSLSQPALTDAGKGPESSADARPLEDLNLFDGGVSIAGRARDGGVDAGEDADAALPPPEAFDPYAPPGADRMDVRELSGVELRGRWVWRDVPAGAAVPQANTAAIQAANTAAAGRWNVMLSDMGRMRMEVVSKGQALSPGSAVLARASRYGHAIVWPNGLRYRIVGPGVMRSVLSEQRADVSPLSRGTVRQLEGGTRLERPTRTSEVRSAIGAVVLEQTEIPETGSAAPLMCRFLVELVGVDPDSEVCGASLVVVAAQLRWIVADKETPGIEFEVESIERRADLPAQLLMLPPPGAVYETSGLPLSAPGSFFDADALASFRTEATAAPSPPDPSAPEQGLAADNRSDHLLWLLLDGVPVTTVAPWQQRLVIGPRAGRYTVQWRTFFGELVDGVAERDIPARLLFGNSEQPPDGGVEQ